MKKLQDQKVNELAEHYLSQKSQPKQTVTGQRFQEGFSSTNLKSLTTNYPNKMQNVKNIDYKKEFYKTKRTNMNYRTSLNRGIQQHRNFDDRSLIVKSQNQNDINLKKYYKSLAEKMERAPRSYSLPVNNNYVKKE